MHFASLLRQAIGPRQCFAGLEQALEARQDLRPASRHGIDEFICALLLGLMGDRKLHHIALRVPDLRAVVARLKSRGVKMIDDEPRPGAGGSLIAFVHPAGTGGVLLELKQEP